MKKLIPALLLFAACSKNNSNPQPQPTPNPCPINQALLVNKIWKNKDTLIAPIGFMSNGDYYQKDTSSVGPYGGKWQLTNGCDSIYITRSSFSNFTYRVIYVDNDSLSIFSPFLSELHFYH